MDHDDILKLVSECAEKLSPDPFTGLKNLEAEFKDNPHVLQAVLMLIALNHKEHFDVITSYMQVGHFISQKGKEKKYEDHVSHFPTLRQLFFSRIDALDMQLELRNYKEAEKTILQLIEELTDLMHSASLGRQIDRLEKKEGVHVSIEAFQKNLNRLSDYIVVKDQDKILREMVTIQKALKSLESQVTAFLEDHF